jgi:twitching motility protein PilT
MEKLLKRMIDAHASDLLLEADAPLVLRIGGKLEFEKKVYPAQEISDLLLPLLTPFQKERLEKEKQIDLSYALPEGSRFRINLHYQKGSLAAAIRALSQKVPARQELGLPPIVEEWTRLASGLILVTGPTSSGKTTTQACMIELINHSRSAHIITIEDPIEYVFKNVKSMIEQREIGEDATDFAGALRSALRQNPDVILIGEMRDLETISTAITAAETGHLIISTLHTANTVNAIDRIIDVFPASQQNQIRSQLSLTLQGIISQQLIPRKEGVGLVLACEVLLANSAVRNIIRKGATQEISSMIELGKQAGMRSMDMSLKELADRGLISREEALSRAVSRDNFI